MNELLYSTSYTVTDYIWEAYGKQISGREWGLGARLNGPTNLYSSNFYADLNTTNNLYVYKWLNNNGSGSAIELGSVALGAVNLNTWYKLSMAVHSTVGRPSGFVAFAQFEPASVVVNTPRSVAT